VDIGIGVSRLNDAGRIVGSDQFLTSCDGCPWGPVEYEVIPHRATDHSVLR